MTLFDVNVLVYAYRDDSPQHRDYRRWLIDRMESDEPYALTGLVLSGFARIVSNHRIFRKATPIEEALEFCRDLHVPSNAFWISPGPRHWGILERLCRQAGAKGNLVTDAYLAALAIEWGCELITTDRDFARFEGLRWRHPLAG